TASCVPRTRTSKFLSRTLSKSNLRAALFGANLLQPIAHSVRKPGFYLRRDQTDRIHIDDVRFVLEPKTGELHSHQIGYRRKKESFDSLRGFRKVRNGRQI